ncbi:general secretion pathway protein GspB [Massilia agilis]|uniref:General secretion pathway protein GspB n=1 Tax=Massilia agilis TaxID=1811226 RepID=A0ABT2DCZ9_9BURK|nr:general secretion pathway protein GspB [Massilia agilis]MCS0808744.1 general secretion pathway protein GspB [Massilia agilis]
MSYILEALKKAQAERQLGSAPTIHAPAAHGAPQAAQRRKPLVIGAAAGVLLVAGAILAWRQHAGTPAPAVVAQAAAPAVAPGPAPAHDAAVAQHPPAAASPAPAVALVGAPDAPPAAAKPARPPAEPVRKAPEPAPAATSVPAEVAKPAVVAPVSADDGLPTLNGLPDAVRRDVPKVAFGGYMYSPNPADRLVLVDKTLRHEGEEVAPGLMLEKLLPKGAVLNFRGYRYRVPF